MRRLAWWVAVGMGFGCSAEDSSVRPDLDGGAAGSGGISSDASPTGGATASDAAPPNDGGGAGGLVDVPPPPAPAFPETIGTLTVALRTATADASNTDDPIEICLTATDCFMMDTPEVNDRELGETDELHFANVNLPRSAVDRVVIRSASDPSTDNDRYTPACMHLRFDGEPVYCNDVLDVHIGTGTTAKEVKSYSDPAGLHQTCRSCWSDQTLTHGPMVGAPGNNSARVWARSDATRNVGLRVGESTNLTGAPVVDWAQPSPDNDYTTELEAVGLEPGKQYYYRVEVDGDTSAPVRPLRASLATTTDRVRVAFGSCSLYQPSPSLAAVSALAPDLFFFVGDNHYANAQHVDAHRWMYRRMRLIPPRAELMATTPTLAIWDDHDFLANNSHGACARPEHALQGFSEYWSNPAYGTSDAPGVFFRHREGPAEIFALDCRMYRPDVGDPQSKCELAPNPPNLPMSGGPIGPVQMKWLLDGVESSTAPFKLLACGSRFTEEGGVDSWASFPAALKALQDGLHDRKVEGVVFLSGDIHRSRLRENPRANGYTIPELTSSPLARPSPADTKCASEPGEKFCIYDNSFVLLDITAQELVATVHAESGKVLYTWNIPHSLLAYP